MIGGLQMLLMSCAATRSEKCTSLIAEATVAVDSTTSRQNSWQVAPEDDGPHRFQRKKSQRPSSSLRSILQEAPSVPLRTAANLRAAADVDDTSSIVPQPPPCRERLLMRHRNRAGRLLCAAAGIIALTASSAMAQEKANKANWELAEKFSSTSLRSRVYTTAVNPRWLGQSDSLCYDWKDHTGSSFFLVVPTTKTKRPLFDQVKLASTCSRI